MGRKGERDLHEILLYRSANVLLSVLTFAFVNHIMSNESFQLFENDVLVINAHEFGRILENEKIINLDENQVLGNE